MQRSVRALVLVFATGACRGSASVAPKDDALRGVDCKKVVAPAAPELLAWDARTRAQLDQLRKQGVVALRYEVSGCEVSLTLLPQCIGPKSKYVYSAHEEVGTRTVHDASELMVQLPVGATNVAGPLRTSGSLRADTKVVGTVGVPEGTAVTEIDFVGPDCKQATHIVRSLDVGGFGLFAGDEVLAREGTPLICDRAAAEGIELGGCSVPLRLGLVPFAGSGAVPAGTNAGGKRLAVDPAAPTSRGAFDQGAVERVVRQHQGDVRRACWETGAERLKRITVSVTTRVDVTGRVISAEGKVTDADGPSDVASAVGRCVANEVKSWPFPEPEGEKVVTLPFHLFRQ